MKIAKQSDWKTTALPSKQGTMSLDRSFSSDEIRRMQAGLVPEQMEDKWFVYWHEDTLFFHRSWTGICIYAARFVPDGDSYQMFEVDVNRDPEEYGGTNDDHDAKMIEYLIDVLLLRKFAEFPSEESDSEKKALMQWSQVGRAMFGEHPKDE